MYIYIYFYFNNKINILAFIGVGLVYTKYQKTYLIYILTIKIIEFVLNIVWPKLNNNFLLVKLMPALISYFFHILDVLIIILYLYI